jgi:ribosome silencing factor RsfS/YbeB/iojap
VKEIVKSGTAAAVGTRVSAGSIELSEFDDRVRRAINAAAEKKAMEPTVLDLRGISSFTDFFVIVTGANRRQVQAISDEVVEQLKRSGSPAARVEGYQNAEWILIDWRFGGPCLRRKGTAVLRPERLGENRGGVTYRRMI